MKILVESNDLEMWKFIINGPYISTYYINNKVVNKVENL